MGVAMLEWSKIILVAPTILIETSAEIKLLLARRCAVSGRS